MWFLDWIINRLNDASDFFYELYLECYYSWYIPNAVAYVFYYLSNTFINLAKQFNYFDIWVDDTVKKLETILSIEQIRSYLWYPLYMTEYAFVWVKSSVMYISQEIRAWWGTTQLIVKTWIDNAIQGIRHFGAQLEIWLGSLQVAWDNFKGMIPSISEILAWFANWWGKILANIIAWGALPGILISTLIDSKIRDWFPFYDELANLWNDIKLFFIDPLQWLYDRAEDFFERFW